jgi:hypothetical protein
MFYGDKVMKEYKGKTLIEWLEEIAAMDEETLKGKVREIYDNTYGHSDDDPFPAGVHSSGEIWCKLARNTLMGGIMHKFRKNIEDDEDKRAVDEGENFKEEAYFKGTKYE